MKHQDSALPPAIKHLLLWLCLITTTAFSVSSLAAFGGEAGNEEPLLPDEAFALSTEMLDANTLRASWEIADGYYLYKSKFRFTANTAGITLGEGDYPAGKIKDDEFFGRMETYRHQVSIDIPLQRTGSAATLDIDIVSQGCADLGLCYPPQTKKLSLNLPALISSAAAEPAGNSFNPLGALKNLGNSLGLGNDDDHFLHPDQAFVFSAEAIDGNTLRAHWDIADGIYMYRDKFSFELQNADGVSLGQAILPEGKIKVDQSFGEMEVYYHQADIIIPLTRNNLDATEVLLVANYQGCADAGFCYPPISASTPVQLPVALSATRAATTQQSPIFVSEQDRIASTIAAGNTLVIILAFFGFGLLLTFTPCVFPMIPILSSIIVGEGEGVSTRRAFTISLVYVLAMALTYTVAGIAAGLSGENLQAAFQNPWMLGTFSIVFVLLALSMFGFYELQMPAALQTRLTNISNKQKGGTLIGVAIMGFLSALIVGPCVAAPLIGALIYISQTGDAVLGGIALFALSMGMGTPLLIIGTSAGKILPRAGDWMNTIKAVFGVMLLAVAIWMLERILPAAISLALWAALVITSGIFMGALEPYGKDGSGWQKLWKGIGIILLVYGVLMLIGVASGGRDPLQPLHGLMNAENRGGVMNTRAAENSHPGELAFKRIKGVDELDREISTASANGQYVMLDLYADWCVSCKEMEKFTFSDNGVQTALQDVVLLQADVTANDDVDKALLDRFGLFGPPTIMFFGSDGEERRPYRVVGFMNAGDFRNHLQQAMY